MTYADAIQDQPPAYSTGVRIDPALTERNRLTTAFRFFLALPHLLLVGGPAAVGGWLSMGIGENLSWGSTTGIIGWLVGLATLVSWFVIVITARHPETLRRFALYYLRWRVRAVTYMTLLRDEYPPFGEGDYPASLVLDEPTGERDRVTVLLRLLLVIPHLILLAIVGFAWGLSTAIAWVMILLTGRYPETLYGFAIGALAWSTRVEAYLLLLHDDYPPFTLRA